MRMRIFVATLLLLGLPNISYGSCLFAVDSYVGAFFCLLLWIGTGIVASLEFKMAKGNNRRYLTTGVPVFCLEQFCEQVSSRLPSLDGLFNRSNNRVLPSIHFQSVSQDEYAFAEKIGFKHKKILYGPVMRGIIQFDNECSRIVVKGMMNWFPAAFTVAWLFSFGFTPLGMTVLSAVIAVYVYQALRYFHVTRAVAEVWAAEFGVDEDI